MNIKIGDTLLNYKINNKKYIITYVEEYNTILDKYLINIFEDISLYNQRGLVRCENVSGPNAEFICKNLKINGVTTLGQIIISDGVIKNDEIKKTIESVYGDIGLTIGATYHALAYLKVSIEEIEYYLAIETTNCDRYKLQFYVGSNENELENIIKIRYQSNDVRISSKCDESWYGGGKKKKTKKTKTKTKKKKTKKTKKRKRKRQKNENKNGCFK